MNIPTGSLVVMIASAISVIVGVAMFFLVLWQAPRNRDNQLVALYMAAVVFWSVSAFMTRFADVLGGNPSTFGYLIATGIGATALVLQALAVHFADLWERWWAKALVDGMLLYLIVITPVSYRVNMYGEFVVLANGQLDYRLSPLALVSIAFYYTLTLIAVVIMWRNRRRLSSSLLYGSLATLAGMLTSLVPPLTQFAIPILSNVAATLFFSRAILQENLFNPLAELNRELAEANRELEHANQMKSQFLANMSHELRTPLNSIIGYTELLLNELYGPITEEQEDRLDRVLRNGRNLLLLINDVLDLSKIEAGRMELSQAPVNVPELIEGATNTLLPLANEKGLELETRLPESLPTISGDEGRLRQILVNLLSNAVKFTEEGRVTVVVSVDDSSEFVDIAVSDTGMGIPPDHLENIFEEFHQVDGTTTREHGGTGLGLAISRKLAHLHGGDLLVDSEVGEGTTFTLRLPVAARDAADPAEASIPPREKAPSGPLVLVIDDQPEAIDIIREHLTSAGYRVEAATSGADGLQIAQEQQPDAITLDLMMPETDGWEVLTRLRSQPDTASIPVVIVSIVDNRPQALKLGAYDYIAKPIQQDQLVQSLRRAISAQPRHPVLIVDDNADDRDLISTILSNEGYPVAVVEGGQEAIDWLKQRPARCVVLDLMMPRVSGFDVLAYIRSRGANRDLPVVVVTAKDLTVEEYDFLSSRLADVIRKEGLAKEQLIEEIEHALQQ